MPEPTTDPTTVELTERQSDVLRLHREGKTPTEIGNELGISSQGVHGHLRRLRHYRLVEPLDGSPKRAATKRPAATRNGLPFDPASTIAAVRQAIADQREQLDSREAEIDAEIAQLQDEKTQIAAARKELDKLTPAA